MDLGLCHSAVNLSIRIIIFLSLQFSSLTNVKKQAKIQQKISNSKWGSGKRRFGLPPFVGEAQNDQFYHTLGSLPSETLSLTLSLCKNAMTSAIRRANSSWPAEALKTAVSQDIVFLSLSLPIFTLKLSSHSFFRTHPSRYHLIPQPNSFTAISDCQFRGASILLYIYISTSRKKGVVHNSFAAIPDSQFRGDSIPLFYVTIGRKQSEMTTFCSAGGSYVHLTDCFYTGKLIGIYNNHKNTSRKILPEISKTKWTPPYVILWLIFFLWICDFQCCLQKHISILGTTAKSGSTKILHIFFVCLSLYRVKNVQTATVIYSTAINHNEPRIYMSFFSSYNSRIKVHHKSIDFHVRLHTGSFHSETTPFTLQVMIPAPDAFLQPRKPYNIPNSCILYSYDQGLKSKNISWYTPYGTGRCNKRGAPPLFEDKYDLYDFLSITFRRRNNSKDCPFSNKHDSGVEECFRYSATVHNGSKNVKIFAEKVVRYFTAVHGGINGNFGVVEYVLCLGLKSVKILPEKFVHYFIAVHAGINGNFVVVEYGLCLVKHIVETQYESQDDKRYVLYSLHSGSLHSETMTLTQQVMTLDAAEKYPTYIMNDLGRCNSFNEIRNLSYNYAECMKYCIAVHTEVEYGKISVAVVVHTQVENNKLSVGIASFTKTGNGKASAVVHTMAGSASCNRGQIHYNYVLRGNGDSDSSNISRPPITIHETFCSNTSNGDNSKDCPFPNKHAKIFSAIKKADNSIGQLINLFLPLNPYRSTSKMPANKKNRDPRVRAYDPIQEAQIPTSNLTWERQAVNIPRRTTKRSSTFKIPRTSRQEPSTMMPNPPYEALNLTYASSSKTRPRAAVGNKRPADSEKTRDAEAKKAHLEWLHGRAIPDMDREIMKTNVLVDNILTEQTELDTQMLAIRAMGGEEAYNNAYKAHDGLRRAIAKRLHDTKRKRAKQFETIRSMRTMLRTLVAEIGDNADNRQHILRSRYSSLGSSNTPVTAINTLLTNLNLHSYIATGPNPRSLLRPEINRDNNLNVLPSVSLQAPYRPIHI